MCKSFEEPVPLERSQGCKHSFCDHMLNFIGSPLGFDAKLLLTSLSFFFLFFFRSTLMTNLWRAARRTFGMRHNAAIKWWLIIITPISTSHSEACLVLARSKINVWTLPVESVNLCNVSFGGPVLCKICFNLVFILNVFYS